MKRALSGLLSVGALLLGCSDFQGAYEDCFQRGVCLEEGDRRLGPPSATASSVEVSRAVGATADGVDLVEVTVTVRDAEGNGLPELPVVLTITGEETLLEQPAITDTAGKTVGQVRSTRAELKIVTATLGTAQPLQLRDQPSIRFEAGAPARLQFQVGPGAAQAGEVISPAVRVQVTDAQGNPVSTATHPVTLATSLAPEGATLTGSATLDAVGGVATFLDLSLDRPGQYRLSASALGLEGAESEPFEIRVGRPSALVFQAQPQDGTAGQALSAFQVALLDSAGNVLTSATEPVTLTLLGASEGSLEGAVTETPVDGVAHFSGLSIRTAHAGYVLAAAAGGGFASALSDPFDITPGAISPSKSGLQASPATARADGQEQVALTATVVDELYNPVSGAVVAFAASGSDNALGTPPDPTSSSGTALGTLRSIGIGAKTVSATATLAGDTVVLEETAAVTFTVPPPMIRLDRPTTAGGCVTLEYAVQQTQSLPVDVVLEYDLDGSGQFRRLTQAGSSTHDGVLGVTSSAALGGRTHRFLWNSTADLPRLLAQSVRLRATASARGAVSEPVLISGLAVDNGISLDPPVVTYANGSYATMSVADDFDRDGDADLVLFGNLSSGRGMSLLYGNGDGPLVAGPGIATPGTSAELSARTADFNRDGRRDVLFTKYNTGTVYVSFGGGPNHLQAPVGFNFSTTAQSAEPGDFDRDGDLDILVGAVSGLQVLAGDGAGSFSAPVSSPVGANVHQVGSADFNGDGILDALTSHSLTGSGRVELRLGLGNGTFANPAAASVPLPYQPFALKVGDLNRDGVPDVALTVSGARLAVLLGQRGGGLGAPATYSTISNASQFVLNDLNGDGALDAVGVRGDYYALTVLPGRGDGTFHSPLPYISGNAFTVAAGDATGDGRPDLMLGHSYTKDATLFINRTARPCESGWRAPALVPLAGISTSTAGPTTVAVADFNRDGKPDLAAADSSLHLIHVLTGTGNGDFRDPVRYAAGGVPTGLRAGDIDGDGAVDLVSGNDSVTYYYPDATGTLTVLKGLSDGTFRFWDELQLDGRTQHVALADLDGDARLDLIAPTHRNGAGQSHFASMLRWLGDVFAPPATVELLPVAGVVGLEVGDVNADGRPDLISGSTDAGVVVLEANGSGFEAPLTFPGASPNLDSVFAAEVLPAAGSELLTGHRDGTAAVLQRTEAGLVEHARATLFSAGSTLDVVRAVDLDLDGTLEVLGTGRSFSEVSVSSLVDGAFTAAVRSPLASGIRSLETADVNGDGLPDLVFGTPGLSAVGSALGNGDRTFGTGLRLPVSGTQRGAALGDLDADGSEDIVVATHNRVTGISAVEGLTELGSALGAWDLRGVVVGDFNRDGHADVVAPDGSTLRFFAGDGTGALAAPVSSGNLTLAAGAKAAVRTGDINGDGRLDLLVTNAASAALLWGDGDGTFTNAGFVPLGSAQSSQILDVDGDGKLDVAGSNGFTLTVALGDGLGGFPSVINASMQGSLFAAGDVLGNGTTQFVVRAVSELLVYQWEESTALTLVARQPELGVGDEVYLAEADGAGRPDVMTLARNQGLLRVRANLGWGAFAAPRQYAVSGIQQALPGDFNRDGRLDFAILHENGGAASVSVIHGY